MGAIFQTADDGVLVRVDEQGEIVLLPDHDSKRLMNLLGAEVDISRLGSAIVVHAKVPESKHSFRWEFECTGDEVKPSKVPIVKGKSAHLLGLISDLRVALNGRW